ncbi:CRISPR-associated endoribonuclease Cas6 [Oscillatoria acuminata]|uniref:CRISPR-associated endoribonuclease Cas6 n=1 Tax=Oscillatoria acuminata PCC 6304 TaxID=56110 RepID=K9TQH4_9CYAN|nr:CRISPR-associated endoribonuclease Cas6 [Oscillatoria acuminata]AFY84406.1 CRISPR-associated endoribonuclease Cas6 [Oscillatoria acuminata PCC 6304]
MSDNLDGLYSLVVELRAIESGNPPATLGRALHALVLNWLNLANPELATATHDLAVSPFSVSGLIGNRRPNEVKGGDCFHLKIGVLDSQLIQPLLTGLTQWAMQPIILAKFPFLMTRTYMIHESHPLANVSSYSKLVEAAGNQSLIELTFLSPTSFKQKQGIQTFPLPELVFGNLQRRWNNFAPEPLHFPEIEWQGLVSAYELKTHALKLEGGAEIGAQGWIRYRFSDPEQAKIARILAEFAFYAGVGRKTTMGMGQTQFNSSTKPKPIKR